MRIRGILFDKDGTFVDFQRTWAPAAAAVMRTLANGSAPILEKLAKTLSFDLEGGKFLASSPFIGGSIIEPVAAWGAILNETDHVALLRKVQGGLRRESLRHVAPIGDPVAVCRDLKANGLRLGIATNDGEAAARDQAGALGLLDFFDFIAGFDSGFGVKPGPGMVQAFASAMAFQPNEVILVGDTTHDLKAARAAGAIAIAVLSGPATRDDLEAYADHILPSIAALPALVQDLSGGR
jgi:phosphoglycolate phosphatase